MSYTFSYTQSKSALSVVFKGNRLDIMCCVKLRDSEELKRDSFLFSFFKKVYAPFLLKEWVRPIIVSNSGSQPHPCRQFWCHVLV